MPEAMHQHGCQLFEQVARLGLEGIMAKHWDGPYLPGKRSLGSRSNLTMERNVAEAHEWLGHSSTSTPLL